MKNVIGAIVLAVAAVFSLKVGVESIALSGLFETGTLEQAILLTVRLPRTISLVLAGASLSVSGLVMQRLTQNKFISPTTSGTMDSARLGILVSMLFFSQASVFHKTLLAFLFAVGGTFIFTSLLRLLKLRDTVMVPLIGLMYGGIVGSIATFLAYQNDLVQNVASWMQGSFALINSQNYGLIWLALPVLVTTYVFSHRFAVMGMGEEVSVGLGVSYKKMQLLTIIMISLVSSAVILTVGNIPFIGVVIPNIVAMKKGDHLKTTLLPIAWAGSLFLLCSDLIARLIIAPYEMPVGLIAGIIGSLLFLFLLFKEEG